MRTFFGTPNQVITFKPIGKEHITSIAFDENGEFATDNPQIIEKFFHVYDSMPTDSRVEQEQEQQEAEQVTE